MLDEPRLRKLSFREGPKIVLGDDQAWTFPRPWLRLYPVRGADGLLTVGGRPGYGPDYDDLVDQLVECDHADTAARLGLQFQMAAHLLQRNYTAHRSRLASAAGHRRLRSHLRTPLEPDQPGVAGPRPKTFSRWLRHTLIANGITRDLTWEDAIGVAEMLVALGRAVPPSRCVETFAVRAADAARDALF